MASSTQDATTVVTEPLRQRRFQAAYESALPEIMKVPREEYLTINLDIPAVVMLVLGKVSDIKKLRDDAARKLQDFDLTLFDRIETFALAMGYAHSRQKASSLPTLPVQQLSERVVEMRETLITDWGPFARRGWMDAQRIKDLKGPAGYKNQAFDLLTLVAMGREAWSRIQGKTALKAADLDEAEMLADQLLTAVGEREQAPAVAAASSEIRRAAYTLFMRAYDQLRRVAEYLRWDDDDAEMYVPLLTAGRKRRVSEVSQAALEAAQPVQAVLAATAHAETPNNGSSIPVGMPGSAPFASA